MQMGICPKCGALMQEVLKHLLTPAEPTDTPNVTAAVQARHECPDCPYTGELYLAGIWNGNRADLPAQVTTGN